MILKRVLINNEEAFVETTLEDALQQEEEDLVFSSESDREAYEEALEEREEQWEERQEEREERRDRQRFHSSLKNMFSTLHSSRKKGKGALVAALPFLEEEDIHELIQDVLENGDYENLPLTAILPFLNEKDCDELFRKAVIEGEYLKDHDPTALYPFVSDKCLSELVDAFLEGKVSDLEPDTLYPFLESKDVRKLFRYFLKKREDR